MGSDAARAARRGEAELITLAAGTRPLREANAERARELLCALDTSRLVSSLRARRLLATLGPRLARFATGDGERQLATASSEAVRSARNRGRHIQLTSRRIVELLAATGVRCASLKGPDLAESLYGDVGRRVCNDIDVLVEAHALRAAAGTLRSLGYGEPEDPVDRDGLPRLHLALSHARGALPHVDLHWRIHWYETRFAQERLLAPEPVDELAALLLFHARDGFLDVRLACDIGAWWDRRGERLEREELGRLARGYPDLEPVLSASARVAERTVGLPASTLLGRARATRRAGVALRLADPHRSASAAQLYAEMGLIDWLLSPRGGLTAALRRQLLPSAQVLDQRAGRRGSGRTRSKMLYAGRLAMRWGVLARYVRALARAAQPRRAGLGVPRA